MDSPFKPVIKVRADRETGSFLGSVRTLMEESFIPVHGAQITVIAGDTINTKAFSYVNGAYKNLGLDPHGTYKDLAAKEGFISSDMLSVEITEESKTEADFVLEASQE
ncbi:carboxypeptidase-like regulatory domain-containing protein [Aureicoccus marinus]|nr:carboxypeptidase-like regulatory domain-containing protein [Aureicoccus marinus]